MKKVWPSVLILLAAVGLVTAAWARTELSGPNETVQSALTEAQQAMAQNPLPIQINAVGLDVKGDADAIAYLQSVAAIGGGSYYEAADVSQVEAALTGAATAAVSAFGGAPTILSPRNGEAVGPSATVTGTAKPGQLVVVWTEVYNGVTGELLKKIPGHRRLANEQGHYSVVISTPRVFRGPDVPLRYEIHAQAFDGQQGSLEAIVTVVSQ
ncbi:MAG: hypothetical protein AB7W28_02000 [Armatimonadota bacterium]